MTYTPALPPSVDDSPSEHRDEADWCEKVDSWNPPTLRERLVFLFWACVPLRLHPERTLGHELKNYYRQNHKYLHMTD
jgi:hypothetical protein